MAAKESILEKIHELASGRILKLLEDPESEITPQMWGKILQLMKDSNITADEDNNPEIKQIQEKIQKDTKDYPFGWEESEHPMHIVK